MNTDRPPYVMPPGAKAAEIAAEVAGVYATYEALGHTPLVQVYNTLCSLLHFDEEAPLVKAGNDLAEALLASSANENAYHNCQHTLEVLLNINMLAQLNRSSLGVFQPSLTARDHQILLVAALIHDLGHDGKTNQGVQFRLEQQSLDLAQPILEKYGVPAAEQDLLTTMVLSTDIGGPKQLLSASYDSLLHGAEAPVYSKELAGFAQRLTDRHAVHLSALLCDADILSSAGLTWPYFQRQTDKLSCESGVCLSLEQSLYFLDRIVGGRLTSYEARFFQGNMDSLRAQLISQKKAEG